MRLAWAMLTAFGLGRSPIAPGTAGSVLPVLIALVMVWTATERWMVDVSMGLLMLAFSIACVRFGHIAEERLGRKDPSEVVADEVAGQSIALLFLPWRPPTEESAWMWNLALAFTAFLTFRLFDITKPPPAHQSQRLGGGWGILVDDLIAGVYALIATQLIARFALPHIV
jgi:phosphatidylglycerophosphatase A